MIDLCLTTGVRKIWQENILHDFTLRVEGHEFQVHKVVLAAVSLYFKAMLGTTYIESKMDKVDVKGFSADIVGKLLEVIYTGEEGVIAGYEVEVLRCAVYLQVPTISQFCARKLMEDLNICNCLEILTGLAGFPFHAEIQKLKKFIQTNWETVMESCNPDKISYEALKVLSEFWKKSEWDMFIFIKNWIYSDLENHSRFVNELMSHVRFCLIGPDILHAIMEMDIFMDIDGPWQKLVINAVKYHQMPINLKVINKSEQSRVRKEPGPVFITLPDPPHKESQIFSLDTEKKLQKDRRTIKMIEFDHHLGLQRNVCVAVNNFVINCHVAGNDQEWHVFDARTLTWSKMTSMDGVKADFVMVHHKNHLYTLGGHLMCAPRPGCDKSERYSFLTDKWSSFSVPPVTLSGPAACILEERMYLSGGLNLEERSFSDALYTLNLSHGQPAWEEKTPALSSLSDHTMSVMKRNGEDAILVIDSKLEMQWYLPAQDQWTWLDNPAKPDGYNLARSTGLDILVKGNEMIIAAETDDESNEEETACLRLFKKKCTFLNLMIPEDGSRIIQVPVKDWKTSPPVFFSAMLAFPP